MPSTFTFGFSDDDIQVSSDEEDTAAAVRNLNLEPRDPKHADAADDTFGSEDDAEWCNAEAISLDDLVRCTRAG